MDEIEAEVEFALKNKILFHNLKETKIRCTALHNNMNIILGFLQNTVLASEFWGACHLFLLPNRKV